jgi:L,D-transpeptidase YcbB
MMEGMKLAAVIAPLALLACAPAAQPPTRLSDWTSESLFQLKAVAAAATQEGLPSERAALDELERFEAGAESDSVSARQVDIAAEALFTSLARSFAQGAVDPARADANWAIETPPPPDLAALQAARANGGDVRTLLHDLLPSNDEYLALRAKLARIKAEPANAVDSEGRTREARVETLRANLERWRWLPRNMPMSRVEVRLPPAEVLMHREAIRASRHTAIIGARETQTPSFAAEIRSITINPSWTPPQAIVRNELLPRFRRDPAAATRQGFDAIDANGAVVDSTRVDWAARPFPYGLRQRPGPSNALGRLRFDLPNDFAIYLHDTPNRALFGEERRLFSHGCIRVDDPVGLAENVLQREAWTRDAIQTAIDTGISQTITVEDPLPVFVLYLTATLDEDGEVAFHDDIYGRDQALVALLDAPDVALVAQPARPVRCPA